MRFYDEIYIEKSYNLVRNYIEKSRNASVLARKIEKTITTHLKAKTNAALLIDGARQVGKTYIVRAVGQKLFKNFIEVNMLEDSLQDRLFADIKTVQDFYLQLSLLAGDKMKEKSNTLVFIDEIQAYPHLLTLLKFLVDDARFTYIASGSQLGIALSETSSIPMGSIKKVRMFPLDFEEFLDANGVGTGAVSEIKKALNDGQSLSVSTHNKLLDFFKKYLIVGGMPAAVNSYIEEFNLQTIRAIQEEIHEYYAIDASKYDKEKRLVIRRIYDMIPSNMENKKKRLVAKDIENKNGKTFQNYENEFEYLSSSGVATLVQAVSNPKFPLIETGGKNLLKLYLNDVGILTAKLFGSNARAVLDDVNSINLGAVYETAVANELKAHGHSLFYYDNRNKGEVDFLIDNYDALSVLPIEVKSGRDYTIHSALNNMTSNKDYGITRGIVLSNSGEVKTKNKITYMPIYYSMFL